MKRLLLAALALCSGLATAQANDITGPWFCTMNSNPATVRMNVFIQPDRTLVAQGEVILNGTSGYFRFDRSPGRWSVGRNHNGQVMINMQVMPQNYPVFSIHAGVVANPNVLLNQFREPQTGSIVETACRRGFS